ncbi:VIT1/CCC1 transporter family protein [Enemella sp. A6]|uniref:VIT1/CCC1 transporter family protein n=1 Tax=Enemella sp. A6 TaxID=3440152 RepID=UPI003EB8805D
MSRTHHRHAHEAHTGSSSALLNWLRAMVLGANDGIVSVSSLLIGIAAAGSGPGTLLIAGLAGVSSGALSMGVGEYVSVSTQRDTEKALLDLERWELEEHPEAELAELAGLYRAKGLNPDLAQQVAEELTRHDALAAHAEVELNIDPDEVVNPWQAAFASIVAFVVGAALPLLSILLLPDAYRIAGTVLAAGVALAITGFVSARLGSAPPVRALLRNVLGGMIAMAITYLIGSAVGLQLD